MARMPRLETMPRVRDDVKQCVKFIARQPWGKPKDRVEDIYRGIAEVWSAPRLNPVKLRRLRKGLEFRYRKTAQFVVIYAYLAPSRECPDGVVSIRAVRHRRIRNIFSGVREPPMPGYGEPAEAGGLSIAQ